MSIREYTMKKIIIIFVVAFCLFFTVVFCFSAKRDNYAEIWNTWSNYEKYVYIWGLRDGLLEKPTTSVYSVLINPGSIDDIWLKYTKYKYLGDSEEVKKEIEKIEEQREQAEDIVWEFCLKFDIEVIRSIVTDLYKDPANSYIYISDMCYLAFWKLKGESIEPILIKLRERASR